MNQPFPLRAIAGCLALAAFAIAIISGLAAGRSTDSIIFSALVAMLIGQAVGYAAGMVISYALLENLRAYTAARSGPAPLAANASPEQGNTPRAAGVPQP